MTDWGDTEPYDLENDACRECGNPLRVPMEHGLRRGWWGQIYEAFGGGGVHAGCWFRWVM